MKTKSAVPNRIPQNRTPSTAVEDNDQDGAMRVAAYELPISTLLPEETRGVVRRWVKWRERNAQECPGHWSDPVALPAVRQFFERSYSDLNRRARSVYDVRIQSESIAGVYTEIFTPGDGVSSDNRKRVLINLHGGAFVFGARWSGQIESIPIAATGKIKVISVDYRMAPEHRFPAATEDVVAVYKELLKDYAPKNIGIYGCSAGALLAAQTIARLQKDGLALPAAIGMFYAAGSFWSEGDSAYFGAATFGLPPMPLHEHPYFKNVDPNDALVAPVCSSRVLARFPPSLLIAATRDQVLSSVVHTHSRLIALGVEANLHVWEGLGHTFTYNPDLPQSREAHDVTVKFFDRHLGKD